MVRDRLGSFSGGLSACCFWRQPWKAFTVLSKEKGRGKGKGRGRERGSVGFTGVKARFLVD